MSSPVIITIISIEQHQHQHQQHHQQHVDHQHRASLITLVERHPSPSSPSIRIEGRKGRMGTRNEGSKRGRYLSLSKTTSLARVWRSS
eukprot:1140080-Rhodomonas_salina.2